MIGAIAGAYARAHARSPLGTSAGLGFVIAGTGDFLCQVQEGRGLADLDQRRVGELALVRALVVAPMLYVYFPWLTSLCPGTAWPRVIARVGLDSVLGAPISLAVIFTATSALKGRPMEAGDRMRDQLVPTWVRGISYWPFVHLLNFRFVGPAHQGLVAHFASVYWMVLISAATNKELGRAAAPPAALPQHSPPSPSQA